MYSFSIIIPTYNSERTIRDCLDSIISQTYTHYEILVMDGVSSDNTIRIAKEYENNNIHIFSEKDSGVYDAMNKGINKAKGQWLYFMGSDDRLYDNNVLENIATYLSGNKCDIIYGNAYFIGRKYFHDGEFTRLKLSTKLNICHQAIFYKKNVFTRLGLYNLDFPINADWDFNLRCFATPDLIIKYIDLPIVYYNDLSGLSNSSLKDVNFHSISPANFYLKAEAQDMQIRNLTEEIANIRRSVTYKVGRFLTAPFRGVRTLIKKL